MTMGIESQLFGWQHPTRAANVENLRLALMFWLRPEGRAVEAADYDDDRMAWSTWQLFSETD
jgi:hypothetical protein